MSNSIVLARYLLLILIRNPGYWVVSLLLAGLGVLFFGYLASSPFSPSIGVADIAQNDRSSNFTSELRDDGAVRVETGDREELLNMLHRGSLWAVVVLPNRFGLGDQDQVVEIITGGENEYSSIVAAGVVRRTLALVIESSAGSGAVVTERSADGAAPPRFIDLVVPGQVGLAIAFGSLVGIQMIAIWREEKILKRLSLTPITTGHLIVAQVVVLGTLSLLQTAALLLFGLIAFGVTIHGSLVLVAAVVAVGTVSFVSIWYGIVAIVRSPVTAMGLSNLVAILMIFLGGTYVPVGNAPSALKPLIEGLPLLHLNNALRDVINRGDGIGSVAPELGILAGWAMGFAFISSRFFHWTAE